MNLDELSRKNMNTRHKTGEPESAGIETMQKNFWSNVLQISVDLKNIIQEK